MQHFRIPQQIEFQLIVRLFEEDFVIGVAVYPPRDIVHFLLLTIKYWREKAAPDFRSSLLPIVI